MTKFKVGDKVTITKPITAYYSSYGGNPEVVIQPGEVGKIKVINVPSVNSRSEFSCVDFEKPGVFQGSPKHNNCTWRIAAKDNELKKYLDN